MPSAELPTREKQLDGQYIGGHDQARPRLNQPLRYTGSLDSFKSQDLTPVIGREYEGLQVRDLLKWGDERIRDLAAIISQRGVVFLRDQDVTTDDMKELMLRITELAGSPESSGLHVHPLTEEGSELGDQISVISSLKQKLGGGLTHQLSDTTRLASAGWHTDISFEPVPSDYAMLKIHTLPETGGDTLWASGYEIYDRLSPALRTLLEGLMATHDAKFFLEEARLLGNPLRKDIRGSPLNQGDGLTAVHPVIRTNPVTGWKSVYVNRGFTRRINGLTKDESDLILGYLFNLVTQNHDAQVRFKWRRNDIAIWDNRSTWHTATYDYGEARVGDRVCSLGEAPYLDPASVGRREALGLASPPDSFGVRTLLPSRGLRQFPFEIELSRSAADTRNNNFDPVAIEMMRWSSYHWDLDRPRSKSDTGTTTVPLLSGPRRRRWSTGALRVDIHPARRFTSQNRASPSTSGAPVEPDPAAGPRQWCEEFCRSWTGGFSRTHCELDQKTWKGVCFARSTGDDFRVREWDRNLRAEYRHTWQPLSDFHYVLQVYFHVADAQGHRLWPELTTLYMSWRTPEQVRIHRSLRSSEYGPRSFAEGGPTDGLGGDSRVPGRPRNAQGIYPLTTHQLFRIARVCNDAEWVVRLLILCLEEFRYWRAAYIRATEQHREWFRSQCARKGIQTMAACLRAIKCVVAELKRSPVLLCEAMGLDPAKVPACYQAKHGGSAMMSGAIVRPETPVPQEQGGGNLSRSFGLQKSSLHAGRIALEMNYHLPFLSHETATAVSNRMLARSEMMADRAATAGESKAEAKMRSLRGKIKDVRDRTEHDSVPETLTLMDSVTWRAAMSPRSGREVRIHDQLGRMPLESLLDILDSLLVPANSPDEHLSAGSSDDLMVFPTVCEPGASTAAPESAGHPSHPSSSTPGSANSSVVAAPER